MKLFGRSIGKKGEKEEEKQQVNEKEKPKKATCISIDNDAKGKNKGHNKEANEIIVLGYGTDGKGYGIYNKDRIHISIFGETGSGKSVTLLQLILQNILRDEGFLLIDPHGMLARNILSMMPKDRWDRVVYINPITSMEQWFGRVVKINPLECKRPEDRYIVAMSFVNALKNLYRDSWGDRLEAVIRNAANALVEIENATLRDMSLLVTDAKFRAQVSRKLMGKDTIHFLNDIFEQYKKDAGSAAYNKLDKILKTPLIAAVLDSPKSSIDFSDVMENGKFVIVDLASGASDDIAAFLGSILIHMMYVEAKRRIDRAEVSLKTPFYLYVDEAHLFSSFALREVLNTMRKFNVKVTLATQTINAFSARVAEEIPALCRTIVSFKCDSGTASMFKDVMPVPPDQMVSLPLHTFAFYSQSKPPVVGIAETKPIPAEYMINDWKEIARHSVQCYGEKVDLQKYIPTRNRIYPDLMPLDMKIVYLLRDKQTLEKEEIAEVISARYNIPMDERSKIFDSIDLLRINHILTSSMEVNDEGNEVEQYRLESFAYSNFFNTKMIGARTGSEKHKAAILYIVEQLWNQITYCKIDLGEEHGNHADIIAIEESQYQDADDKLVHDLETWGEITAIEVETDPANREEQVIKNFKKNKEQGYKVWFAVFNEKAKEAIENILSAKNRIKKEEYNIIILDESELENYAVKLRNIGLGTGLSDDEMKVIAALKNGSFTPARILQEAPYNNLSVDSVMRALNSLEKKGFIERMSADIITRRTNIATGDYRKRHYEKDYFELKEGEEVLEEQGAEKVIKETDHKIIFDVDAAKRRAAEEKETAAGLVGMRSVQVQKPSEETIAGNVIAGEATPKLQPHTLSNDDNGDDEKIQASSQENHITTSKSITANTGAKKNDGDYNDKQPDTITGVDFSRLSDEELKFLLKSNKAMDDRDKDAIIIVLENRGHGVSETNGRIRVYRK